jgi:hypothetical protein
VELTGRSASWGNVLGDTIGCGILIESGEIFYTRGTQFCGVAFTLPSEVMKTVTSNVPVSLLRRHKDAHAALRGGRGRIDGLYSQRLVPCVTIGAGRTVSVSKHSYYIKQISHSPYC